MDWVARECLEIVLPISPRYVVSLSEVFNDEVKACEVDESFVLGRQHFIIFAESVIGTHPSKSSFYYSPYAAALNCNRLSSLKEACKALR